MIFAGLPAGQAHLKIYIARGGKPLMARSKRRGQREGYDHGSVAWP